jgi:hypothetical protein
MRLSTIIFLHLLVGLVLLVVSRKGIQAQAAKLADEIPAPYEVVLGLSCLVAVLGWPVFLTLTISRK